MTPPSDRAEPGRPAAATTAAALAARSLTVVVDSFTAAADAIERSDDPEGVHDLRVTCRRARAQLTLFAACFDDVSDLRHDLRWLTGALGPLRDLDVQIGRLQSWRTELPHHDRVGIDTALASLRERRRAERGDVVTFVGSDRARGIASSLHALAQITPPQDAPRAAVVVPSHLRTRYRKLRRAGDGLAEGGEDATFHRLRIACKRLRYELEPTTALYECADPLARRLGDLQDLLGAQHDAVVAIGMLESLIADPGLDISAAVAESLHRLAHRTRERADVDVAKHFARRYERICGRRWRELDEEMTTLEASARGDDLEA